MSQGISLTANTRMNTRQAAEFLGLSPRLLRAWRAMRPLPIPFYRINSRHVRYERGDLLAFLEKAKVK